MQVQANVKGGPPSPFSVGSDEDDGVGLMLFGPTYDRDVLPVTGEPSLAPSIPVLVGFASHDASLLMCADPAYATITEAQLRDRLRVTHGEAADETYARLARNHPDESARLRLARAVTETTFQSAAVRIAQRHAQQAAPVFAYEFGYQTPVLGDLLGATHSLDLPFVFYNIGSSPFAGDNADRHSLSREMALAWAAFARSGDPNHSGIPRWDPYTVQGRETMRIDATWELHRGGVLRRDRRASITTVGELTCLRSTSSPKSPPLRSATISEDNDMTEFFTTVTEPIAYAGPDSTDRLAFRWYDSDRVVAGRTMAEHLRFAVCYGHSFAWDLLP